MAQEIERELCRVNQCHVFRVPPRTGAAGYRASDWGDQIKVVTLKVVEKGSACMIALFDPATGALYARCPVREGAVERAVDSTRYFVLRVQQRDRHAFLGVAFKTRDEAFDFNVALSDHQKNVEREAKLRNNESILEVQETRDLRIQDGQKIHINIGDGTKRKKKPARSLLGGSAGTGGGLLAPPTRDTPSRRAPGSLPTGGLAATATAAPRAPAPATAAPAGQDLLDFMGNVAVTPAAAPAPAPAPAASAGLDDFAGLSSALPAAQPAPAADPFGAPPLAAPAPAASVDPFAAAAPTAAADPFGAPVAAAQPAPSVDPFAAAPLPVAVPVDPFGGAPLGAVGMGMPQPAPQPALSAGGDPFAELGGFGAPAAPAAARPAGAVRQAQAPSRDPFGSLTGI